MRLCKGGLVFGFQLGKPEFFQKKKWANLNRHLMTDDVQDVKT